MPAVYLQTNDAAGNEVLAFSRAADGSLSPGRYPAGGRGSGQRHLASAGSVVLSPDRRWLLVTNAGSNELSLFEVTPEGLRLADRTESGGDFPTSVTVNGSLVCVLNNKSASISGFRVANGKLTETGRRLTRCHGEGQRDVPTPVRHHDGQRSSLRARNAPENRT